MIARLVTPGAALGLHLDAELAQALPGAPSVLIGSRGRSSGRRAREPGELHRGDGAAAGRLLEGVARVDHLARARYVGHARELHPLDVAHHRHPRPHGGSVTHAGRRCIPPAMAAPTPEQFRELVPLAGLLGIEIVQADPELVRGRLAWAPERCTSGGILHGGAMMALADTCGAVCAFLNLPEGSSGTATVESKTNFLRGVRGGAVVSTSRPLHTGRTMIVVESELVREDGALAAKVTQTQAFHYPRT